jgi:hypothetical protein
MRDNEDYEDNGAETMSMIETLEGRALLSASPTAQLTIQNSAVVLAARQALTDHQAALDQGAQDARAKILADRQALTTAVANGKAAVVAYRASAKADKGNADALAGDKATLKAALAQSKADAAAARTAVKTDSKALKSLFKTGKRGLKTDARAVKTAIKSATETQQSTVRKLVEDGTAALADGTFSNTEVQQLITDLDGIAAGATKPSQASVDQLANDLSATLQGKQLSANDFQTLATDAQAVLTSAKITTAQVMTIAADVQNIFSNLNISTSQLLAIGSDLLKIYNELTSPASSTGTP